MWLVDSSYGNTVARVLTNPGSGNIVKRSPVRRYKRVGDHNFNAYLSNTYYRYQRLFGTPTAFPVMCSLWKWDLSFGPLQTFCELMIQGDFKLWCFPERSHSSTNKNSYFRDLKNATTFVWYSRIVTEKLGYLSKWRLYCAPLFDCPPKRLVWIRHWFS